MAKLFRTRQAEIDLFEIWEYIAKDNLIAADKLIRRLDERSHELLDNPELGPARDDIVTGIGFGANRHLAKIACKMDKPDGVTVWSPDIMPAPLYPLPFDDIPGIGGRMSVRLWKAGIVSVKNLLETQPKQMRKIWGNAL